MLWLKLIQVSKRGPRVPQNVIPAKRCNLHMVPSVILQNAKFKFHNRSSIVSINHCPFRYCCMATVMYVSVVNACTLAKMWSFWQILAQTKPMFIRFCCYQLPYMYSGSNFLILRKQFSFLYRTGGRTQLPTICTWHFQIYFLEWKFV